MSAPTSACLVVPLAGEYGMHTTANEQKALPVACVVTCDSAVNGRRLLIGDLGQFGV
jgi:hypothetical protein